MSDKGLCLYWQAENKDLITLNKLSGRAIVIVNVNGKPVGYFENFSGGNSPTVQAKALVADLLWERKMPDL